MGKKLETKKGYDAFEVISALQKAIRRGQEEHALFWAMELFDSKLQAMACSRIRTIIHEDIGIGGMINSMYALKCLEEVENGYPYKDYWSVALANLILTICRGPKSREGTNFLITICAKRAYGTKLEIPDYALDQHTLRGKIKKRGLRHFFEHGAKLVPENHDKYWDSAKELLIKAKHEGVEVFPKPEKAKEGSLNNSQSLLIQR